MREPHQHRLRLIAQMVPGDEQVGAVGLHRFADQPIARLARRCLQAGIGPRSLPAEAARRQVELFGLGQHLAHFRRRFRPQAVVDGIDEDRGNVGPLMPPVRHQQHQRHAVGPARHREAHAAPPAERREQGIGVDDQVTGHFAFWASASSLCWKAGDRSG